MAAALGISQGYLTDVERGRRKPTPKLADAMAAWEAARQWPNDRVAWHAIGALECGWIVPDFQQLQFENSELRARVRELKSSGRGLYDLMEQYVADHMLSHRDCLEGEL